MEKSRIVKKRNILFFAIALLIMLLFSFSVILPEREGAFADPAGYTPTVSVQSKEAYCGQTFTIDVDLTGNEGLIALYLTLSYDSSVMSLSNIERGEALSGLQITITNPQTELGYGISPMNIMWDGRTVDRSNGNIVKLTFESFSNAPEGTYPIEFTYDTANTNREYGEPIAIAINNGTVTLVRGDYDAIWYDWDDTVLYSHHYNFDEVAAYVGEEPARQEDECYSYKFKRFVGIVSDERNVLKYRADYDLTPKEYQAFYFVDGIDDDTFDGVITTDDYWEAKTIAYGTFLENQYPTKTNYVFSGWFSDPECTKGFYETSMPAKDIYLYGYFIFDIRTTSVPKIQLTSEVDEDDVTIYANMVMNTGFNGMVLTLSYDRTALQFVGFEKEDTFSTLQFDTTNVEDEGYDAKEFKFYYEHSENTYETGVFLKMKFKVKHGTEVGVYDATFVLGNNDATYYNGVKGLRYTEIEIIPTQVPVGKIYKWEKSAEDSAEIKVESDLGMPADTTLKVSLVPEEVHKIEEQTVTSVAGKNKELKAVYDLSLMRILGGTVTQIDPDGLLLVEIKLTPEQQACEQLSLYSVNENGEMISYNFERDGDTLRFETTQLDRWAIVGNKPVASGRLSDAAVMLISMPILLAIATMSYTLILIGKNRKKKGANDA